MTEEQFIKLEDFIQSKIELDNPRANTQESLRYFQCRDEVRKAFGLPALVPSLDPHTRGRG